MIYAVLDIETDTKHQKIWMAAVKRSDEEVVHWTTEPIFLSRMLEDVDIFIGHNILSFDIPVLSKVWSVDIAAERVLDTMIMSQLYDPSLAGGHSLDNWGKILGHPKGDFSDFDAGWSEEMTEYCKNDVLLTEKVYKHLRKKISDEKFTARSIQLEHDVRVVVNEQQDNGFKLDVNKAMNLVADLEAEAIEIEMELQTVFEPNIKQLKTKVKTTPFNPTSRAQVADRLMRRGWTPKLWTDPGNPKKTLTTQTKKPKSQPVINGEILEEVGKLIPEVAPLARLFMLQKRIAQINSWILLADKDGRVHGKVITNGAVSSRMTHHSPNMAQVPAVRKPLGKECRECWIVDEGNVLVGIDASGLELRMLAHYMDDAAFTESVCEGRSEDGTDVHTRNMKAAGLTSRDDAKTFIYAFLYGAGAEKIGSIVGGGAAEGKELIEKFLESVPSLQQLKKKIARQLKNSATLPGLDGRRLRIRSEYAALNQLLQGGGAIVMKRALLIFKLYLTVLEREYNIKIKIVANVHDEWQVECPEAVADTVGEHGIRSIREAGLYYNLRCPLTGEYKYGSNWAETH